MSRSGTIYWELKRWVDYRGNPSTTSQDTRPFHGNQDRWSWWGLLPSMDGYQIQFLVLCFSKSVGADSRLSLVGLLTAHSTKMAVCTPSVLDQLCAAILEGP